jgi:hypothetical protein
MNQKKMKIVFRVTGEVNNGDIVQCPLCRKKFVVIPGLLQYRIDGKIDVKCPICAKPTESAYYEQFSRGDLVELPLRRGKKKEEAEA